jgi:hypothetical protein
MTDLSPAAQAVLDATGRKTWYRNDDIAAALRAAADQIVVSLPQTPSEYDIAQQDGREEAITNLLAIATELEQI